MASIFNAAPSPSTMAIRRAARLVCGRSAGEEFVLPAACDIDRETLAEVSVGLGLGTVHGMAIDRRRT
jgi:hypothetical protein